MTSQILLVEDDRDLADGLRELLTADGYNVFVENDGPKALVTAERIHPDLVLLDLVLPTMSGESVCRQIKKAHPEIVVIILSGKDTNKMIAEGFSLGADDYVTKPFDYEVLSARISARLKEMGAKPSLEVDSLVLDKMAMTVKRDGKEVALTPQEFRLLEYLMMNKGRVLSREMILSRLWGGSADVETRVVDVYVGYLRKKIDEGAEKKLIHTVRGFGYKIDE